MRAASRGTWSSESPRLLDEHGEDAGARSTRTERMMGYGFYIVEGKGARAVVWARDVQQAGEAAAAMSPRFHPTQSLRTSAITDPTGLRQPHVLMCATEDEAREWGMAECDGEANPDGHA